MRSILGHEVDSRSLGTNVAFWPSGSLGWLRLIVGLRSPCPLHMVGASADGSENGWVGVQNLKFSGYMAVSGLCMHDFGARASAPWKIFCCLLKFLLKKCDKCMVGSTKSESRGVGWLIGPRSLLGYSKVPAHLLMHDPPLAQLPGLAVVGPAARHSSMRIAHCALGEFPLLFSRLFSYLWEKWFGHQNMRQGALSFYGRLYGGYMCNVKT